MEVWQKKLIKKYHAELVNSTKCSDELIEKLRSNLALSQADADQLIKLNQPERSKRLYRILLDRLGLFEILKNSFQFTGEERALRILQEVESEDCTNVGSISFDRKRIRGVGKLGLASKVFMGKFGGARIDVAVKELNTTFIDDKTVTLENVEALIKLELHENVARFYGYECRDNSIYIASDAGVITLQDEVKLNLLNMAKFTVLNGCTKGLDHLHNKVKILHKNLKPSNVILYHGNGVKITDFGLPKGNSRLAVADGAGEWMPPEILRQLKEIESIVAENEVEKMFSRKSDIFALGCIFFFTFTNGSHPFGKDYSNSRQENIIHYKPDLVDPNVNGKWKKLIEGMICEYKRERLSVEDILAQLAVINNAPNLVGSTIITQSLPTSSYQIAQSQSQRLAMRMKGKNNDNDAVAVADKNGNIPRANPSSEENCRQSQNNNNAPRGNSTIATKRKSNDVAEEAVKNKKMPRDSTSGESSTASVATLVDPTFEVVAGSQPGISGHEDLTTGSQEPRPEPKSSVDPSSSSPGQFFAESLSEKENEKLTRHEAAAITDQKKEETPEATVPSGESSKQESRAHLSISWDQKLKCDQVAKSQLPTSSPRSDVKAKSEQPGPSSPTSQSQQIMGSGEAIKGHVVRGNNETETVVIAEKMVRTGVPVAESPRTRRQRKVSTQSLNTSNDQTSDCISEEQEDSHEDDNSENGNTLIHQAINKNKSVSDIQYLMNQGVDWKARNNNGSNALHLAAKAGHASAISYLLTLEGARDIFEERDDDGMTPLLRAADAKKNLKAIVKALIKFGASKNAVDMDGDNLLFLAVLNGKSRSELLTLVRDVKVKWKYVTNKCGKGIMHLAAGCGNLQALEYFIYLGADVNDSAEYGKTPLHYSANLTNKRFFETIKLLVAKGGNLHAVDYEGNNLLVDAVFCGRPVVELERLKNLGFEWERKNESGESLLHNSVEGGNVEAVKHLISLGLLPNEKDNSGDTAVLKVAKARGNVSELLTALKNSDAEFNASDNKRNNLVLLAALEGKAKDDLKIMINEFGVSWDVRNIHEQGVVHMAAKGGNAEAIEYFVSLGAGLNARDKMKNTPLHLVMTAEDGFAKTLACLIRNGAKIKNHGDGALKEKLLKRIDKQKKKKDGLLSQEQAQELLDLVNDCVDDN